MQRPESSAAQGREVRLWWALVVAAGVAGGLLGVLIALVTA